MAANGMQEVRRSFEGEIAHALSLVHSKHPFADEALHQVRKDVKRARAALRLLRGAVPEAAYQQENARLRDAARPLARARDVKAMLDTIGSLLASRKMQPHRSALRRLRGELRREHAERRKHLRGGPAAREIAASLEQSKTRIRRWRLPRDDGPILRDGLRRVYRKGRRALKTARKTHSDPALHESRKQVKYLQAAMQTLAEARARRVQKAEKRAGKVAKRLGDDHDLAVLSATIRQRGGDRSLLEALRQKRRKLQKKAITPARRLYERKPKAFVAEVE
jgi:CHAD domain-containing protein